MTRRRTQHSVGTDTYIGGGLLVLAAVSMFFPIVWLYDMTIHIAPLFLFLLVFVVRWRAVMASVFVLYGLSAAMGLIELGTGLAHAAAIVFAGMRLKSRMPGIVLDNMLYWLFLGAPFLTLYWYLAGDRFGDVVLLLIAKEFIVSLLCSLAADILASYGLMSIWFKRDRQQPGSYYFSRMMVHSSLAALMVPYLVYIVASGYQLQNQMLDSMQNRLRTQKQSIEKYVAGLSPNDVFSLKNQGIIQVERMRRELQPLSGSDGTEFIVTDTDRFVLVDLVSEREEEGAYSDWRNNGVIAMERGDIHFWLPDGSFLHALERWKHGYLIHEAMMSEHGLIVTMLVSNRTWIPAHIKLYYEQARVMLYFAAAVLMLGLMYNRVFFRPLFRLARLTTAIPAQLTAGKKMDWHNSKVAEVDMLTANFKTVTEDLSSTFRKTYNLAYYDPLTGLANRSLMQSDLNNRFAGSTSDSEPFAILFFDLDRFKQINDSLGHGVGDHLLQMIARRLSSIPDDKSQIYRISGDEFVLLLMDADQAKAMQMAEHVLEKVRTPVRVEEMVLHLTTSIGIALYPEHGTDANTLMKQADSAMYVAKEKGGNRIVMSDGTYQNRLNERLWIETQLWHALEKDQKQLMLHYQVVVDAKTHKVTGAEALVRWTHPKRGPISPGDFIPVAEKTGLILSLGRWVLTEAAKQLKAWHEAGFAPLRIAVNLSARQLYSDTLIDDVRQTLDESGLDARFVELEMTEGFMIDNPEDANRKLSQLHEMGFHLSIDDFGTGYSSLVQLKQFPLHTLKVDQSFVRDIDTDADNQTIVKAVIGLAKSMNMKIVAEGVETAAEMEAITQLQCDEIQGYWFGHPLPAHEFEAQFLRRKANIKR